MTSCAAWAHRCKFSLTPDGWPLPGRSTVPGPPNGKPVETAEHLTLPTRERRDRGAGARARSLPARASRLGRRRLRRRLAGPRRASRPRGRGQARSRCRRSDPRARRARGARRRRACSTRGSSRCTSPARDDDARLPGLRARARAHARRSSRRTARCRTATCCAIGIALCDALAHAHKRGVVHRDVKPGNVLIPDTAPHDGARDRQADRLRHRADAGDDALTRTGDVVGTLAYMAPEQAEGRTATEAADLYSLALVLYEALAGTNPVRGRGMASTARRRRARGCRRWPGCAATCPTSCARRSTRALLPRPEQRGDLRRLRARADGGALDDVADEQGTVAGSPRGAATRCRAPSGQPAPAPPRGVGAAARSPRPPRGGGADRAALTALHEPAAGARRSPPRPSPAVALVPRLGWLLAALAICRCGWPVPRPGARAAARRRRSCRRSCSLHRCAAARRCGSPALAPLLGSIGLAGAYPALAGQAAPRLAIAAALGALRALVARARRAADRPPSAARRAARRRDPGPRGRGRARERADHALGRRWSRRARSRCAVRVGAVRRRAAAARARPLAGRRPRR